MHKRNVRPHQHTRAMSARLAEPATQLTSGVTLNAVESIADGQQTYTRDQAAYLVALAYEAGRIHAATDDMAEVVACWAEFAEPRATRQQRVAERLAEMEAGHERERRRPLNQWMRQTYVDMDWPEVAVPGTVDPTTLPATYPPPSRRRADHTGAGRRRHLRAVA